MAYLINIENTGLDTDAQVARMAELLNDKGYNVRATHQFGQINGDDVPNPFEGGQGLADWEDALFIASND